ncbi:unnamed protein product [Mycena citricolor]|uniref:Uncharacterized protein n=1 Tax=Mycena citricolor TaxID=2018698 RepID=A0AAD2HN95_9AGAR|nr:unnamed protein product [Mycena citricolor]
MEEHVSPQNGSSESRSISRRDRGGVDGCLEADRRIEVVDISSLHLLLGRLSWTAKENVLESHCSRLWSLEIALAYPATPMRGIRHVGIVHDGQISIYKPN